MAIAKADIQKLVKVQEHDKLLDGLRADIGKIPGDIEALRSEISGDKEKLSSAQEKVKGLQIHKNEKENEMAQKEEAIKKHQGDLNAVKTNEAFKALLKEIEDAKAGVGDLETEIIELLDLIDVAAKEEKDAKAELARAETENNKEVQILEGRKAEFEKKLTEEESLRSGLLEGIPDELTRIYDQTRERREGVALSEVRDGVCVSCHVKPPPQILVDLRKATRIITCDSCQRILYEPLSAVAET